MAEGDLMTTKQCSACKKYRPRGDFHRRSASKDGLAYWCKKCLRKYEQSRDPDRKAKKVATATAWNRANAKTRSEIGRRNRLRMYGITPEHYEHLFKKQKGLCAACKLPETKIGRYGEVQPLSVDHNHVTGKVRGLLCHFCNIAAGMLCDDPKRAIALARYLRRNDGSR